MALCESPYPGTDSAYTGSLTYPTTPPFMNTYPMTSTPLILPRDWTENYFMPSATDPPQPDNYEFQSNHLETTHLPFGIIPSLAGLGLRNVDLDQDIDNVDYKPSSYQYDNLSPIQGQDSRRHNRISRTEAVYISAAGSSGADTQNHHLGYSYDHGSPWTLSSILRAADFAANNTTSELDLTRPDTTESQPVDEQQSQPDLDGNAGWSFEQLSAATGLSVADFAAQISATAEATLKRMGAGNDLSSVGSTSSGNDSNLPFLEPFDSNQESLAWLPLAPNVMSMPFTDINLRTLDLSWSNNCAGVNPAEILPNSASIVSQFVRNGADSSTYVDAGQDRSTGSVPLSQNRDSMSLQLPPEITRPPPNTGVSSPPEEAYVLPLLRNASRDAYQGSDDDAFQSPSSSEYSPFLQPLGSKRNHTSRVNTRRSAPLADVGTPVFDYGDEGSQQHSLPINLGTPVFDAHRGIDIEELKAKAERYRLRNQGRDYDKRWLISFAGKLSVRGELVDEFRCYVAGCKQVNKRRDHILIHVGAHLDQRPFKCMHCTARFLRKNECKRHELSHTGVRPFSCHLCPVPATTFVRQDLLKRHMKRTHRIDFKFDKENEEPARPRKRAKI